MRFQPILFICQLRLLRPALYAGLPACAWVLFTREPLFNQLLWPLLFIFLHCMLIVRVQGQPASSSFAFLYSRGFSRDALWAHTMLASLAAALAVVLPAALLLWTPARALLQDRLCLNPLFTFVAPRERAVPLYWLAFYFLFLPPLHYTWIRLAQPVRSPLGDWVAWALLATILTVLGTSYYSLMTLTWFQLMLWCSGGALSLLLLLAGWRIHRSLEVWP